MFICSLRVRFDPACRSRGAAFVPNIDRRADRPIVERHGDGRTEARRVGRPPPMRRAHTGLRQRRSPKASLAPAKRRPASSKPSNPSTAANRVASGTIGAWGPETGARRTISRASIRGKDTTAAPSPLKPKRGEPRTRCLSTYATRPGDFPAATTPRPARPRMRTCNILACHRTVGTPILGKGRTRCEPRRFDMSQFRGGSAAVLGGVGTRAAAPSDGLTRIVPALRRRRGNHAGTKTIAKAAPVAPDIVPIEDRRPRFGAPAPWLRARGRVALPIQVL